YMCCTSIFYFYDLAFNQEHQFDSHELVLTAKSQRLSLLCHIALVLGMSSYARDINTLNRIYSGNFYLKLASISFILSLAFNIIPGLSQFALFFNTIFAMATVYILYCGLRDNSLAQKMIGLAGFIASILSASLTGMKEPI